jgi:hypothetical protein
MCELSGMSSYYLLLPAISQADKPNRYLAFLENQQSTIWSKNSYYLSKTRILLMCSYESVTHPSSASLIHTAPLLYLLLFETRDTVKISFTHRYQKSSLRMHTSIEYYNNSDLRLTNVLFLTPSISSLWKKPNATSQQLSFIFYLYLRMFQ